jgi:ATP-dependent Clp protease ATP-binding subunit ClpX
MVGRLPVFAVLEELNREALREILLRPKNALIKQYMKLMKMEGVNLRFEQEAIDAIIDEAIERKTGARALRSVMEQTMMDMMFAIPSKRNVQECLITKEVVLNNKKPTLIFQKKRA